MFAFFRKNAYDVYGDLKTGRTDETVREGKKIHNR